MWAYVLIIIINTFVYFLVHCTKLKKILQIDMVGKNLRKVR